jgi:hypothetical protein
MVTYRTPTRPYGIVDAVNRAAAATGSIRYAAAAAHADYNGHRIHVTFNDYRQYWVTDYTWAGRNVPARGSLESCLDAALREHGRGALVICHPRCEAEIVLCVARGLVPSEDGDAVDATWRDPRFSEVGQALWLEKHCGIPATSILINADTVEDYRAQIVEAHSSRRRALLLGE